MTPARPYPNTPMLIYVRGIVLATLLALPVSADTASDILAMTGARTRIVWAHQVKGEESRWGSGSPEFTLMGFDTTEGRARVILPGPASYGNPSITPDGSRIVYTDVSENNTIYIVDWDGKNKEKLRPGYALCAWADTETGIQWIYAAKAEFVSPIIRFQLDNPESQETVWDKACGPSSGFQVSADGTRAGCVRNHPNVGTIYFDQGNHASHGWGCEAGFAPDNSYRFFHMGEWVEHAGVNMYDADGANKRTIHFGKFPDSPGYDAWNPRWSSDVRFMTVSSPNAGMEQDVYLGVFDADITRVEKWIRISHTHGQDLSAHAWIDPGPRSQTVRVDSMDEKNPPRVLATGLRDETTLQVWFDQPVYPDNVSATFKSGVRVERIQPGSTHYELALKLSGSLMKRDTLKLAGGFDGSVKRRPAPASIDVRRMSWPADRTDLLLLWSADERQRFHYDPGADRFLPTHLTRKRIARIGRHGELILRGGTLIARGAGRGIAIAVRKSNAFSIEAMLISYSGTQGSPNRPRRIVSCNAGPKLEQVNFAICQQADALMFYCYTKSDDDKAAVRAVELCTLEPNVPHHVVVSFARERIRTYLDGKAVEDLRELNGELPWRDVTYQSGLTIGGYPGEASTWWGEVNRLALFSRALDGKEVASNYKACRKAIASRARPPQVRLRAQLAAKSKTPSVADVAPYVDALIVNEYEVLDVLSGKHKPRRVRVVQWGLVGKAPQAIAKRKLGTEVQLLLEPFDDHPELENDPIRDTLDENFDLDLFLDVTMPRRTTTRTDE